MLISSRYKQQGAVNSDSFEPVKRRQTKNVVKRDFAKRCLSSLSGPCEPASGDMIPALPAWSIDWLSSISYENVYRFHICFTRLFSLVLSILPQPAHFQLSHCRRCVQVRARAPSVIPGCARFTNVGPRLDDGLGARLSGGGASRPETSGRRTPAILSAYPFMYRCTSRAKSQKSSTSPRISCSPGARESLHARFFGRAVRIRSSLRCSVNTIQTKNRTTSKTELCKSVITCEGRTEFR